MTIIAAIDDSATARPVLDTAKRLATLLGASVDVVHVRTDGSGAAAAVMAEAAGWSLRVRDGDVAEALCSELRERGAVALVIGSRGESGGASPAGHVALELVQSLECTVVVVPPGAVDRPLRRVLVAVEGRGPSTGLRRLFDHLDDLSPPEVIALHVIEGSALPPFADSPVFEAEAFVQELRTRVAHGVVAHPSRVRVETRIGDPADVVCDAVRELNVDLVVLAWHRDLSGGHGRLVREVLARGSVPVVLFGRDDDVDRSAVSTG